MEAHVFSLPLECRNYNSYIQCTFTHYLEKNPVNSLDHQNQAFRKNKTFQPRESSVAFFTLTILFSFRILVAAQNSSTYTFSFLSFFFFLILLCLLFLCFGMRLKILLFIYLLSMCLGHSAHVEIRRAGCRFLQYELWDSKSGFHVCHQMLLPDEPSQPWMPITVL